MFRFSSHFLVSLLVLASALLCNAADSSTKIGNGYRLISIQDSPDGGFVGYLQVKQKNNIYGPDIPLLQLYVKHETDGRLRVHITDAEKQRWEVPYNLLPRAEPPMIKSIARSRKSPMVAIEYSNTELIFSYTLGPFEFAVQRRSNRDTLFNSTGPFNSLVFKDQYLEISTQLPKDASLYGLGENTQPSGIKLKPNEPYTLYTTDISAYKLNTDLNGSHPVYMDLRNVGQEAKAHAVLLLNSNGMDAVYTGTSLTYKVIGGVLDFYFFSGPTPLAVVDQYTEFVGRPAAMPYWSLGINVNYTYDVYRRGMASDVFIKYHGKPYLAQVWPRAVYFPDFLNPKTVSWWGDEIKKFHELIPVDGLWLDMNEASNFCSGLCTIPEGRKCPSEAGPRWECCLDCRNITNTRWDEPPYKINASGMVEAPVFKTIATSATHYNGVLEYNAHSLYGFS